MKKCTGCLFSGSVHGGGVCDNWGGVDHRSGVDHGGCVDNRVGNSNGGSGGGERSSAVVGDLSDIAVDAVGGVLHMLDPAIWKSHRVGTRDNTVGISGLSSVEVGLGVVVGNTVSVGVGLRGLLDDSDSGGMVGRGGVDNRGSMDGVHNRGSVVDGV